MKTIEYKIGYQVSRDGYYDRTDSEKIKVKARDINSGYAKALKLAKQPLGGGEVREISSVEFWQVIA